MGSLESGSVFAGFRIDSVIARGGMGVVYLADQEQPHRRVALKLIAPERVDDPAYRERFLRESELLAGLEHPNIVPIHAAGEWEGQLYLAMRYVDGPTLAQRLKDDGPLSVDETVRILAPVADALDTAHEQGLIHRDVKPANILLSQRRHVYLTDFGLTKRAGSMSGLTMPGMAIGTEGYMAPEQFTGTGDPDLAYRIDIYALGCVIHACLTGMEPFPRDSYEAVMWAHVFAPPPRLSDHRPDLGTRFDDVLKRALAKDPAERHAAATELIADIRTAGLAPASNAIEGGARSENPDPRDAELPRSPGSTVVADVSDATPSPVQLDAWHAALAPLGPAADVPEDVASAPAYDAPDMPSEVTRQSPAARRRWSIVMLSVAGVVLAIAGLIGLRSVLLGSGASGGAPGQSAAAVLAASAAPSATLDPAYASLLSVVPPSLGGCHDPGEHLAGSLATVHCFETGVPQQEAIYRSFADRAALDAAWGDFLRTKGIAPDSGACPARQGEMAWPTGAYTVPRVERGRLLCYVSSIEQAVIEKTFFEKPFFDSLVWLVVWRDESGQSAAAAERDLAALDALVASDVFNVGPSVVDMTAANMAFVPNQITVFAGKPWRLRLKNEDLEVLHGVMIHRVGASDKELFSAQGFRGPSTQTFDIPALSAGEYVLVDPSHPEMTATITVNG
jgi:serine/threonine protein kinase